MTSSTDVRGYQVKAVGHTGITVANLERSCRFYRDVLGLTVTRPMRLSGASVSRITGVPDAVVDVAFVKCAGHVLELLCFVSPEHKVSSTLRTCDPGFFHLCFKVQSLDRVLEAARAHGFEPLSDEPETLSAGPAAGMRVVYVRDPDGVVLEFAEDPPGVDFESLFFPDGRA